MTYAAVERASFLFELGQFGEPVTYSREVEGQQVEQEFDALVAELGATDCTLDELEAYHRVAVMDLLADAVDRDAQPVSITVRSTIIAGGERWQILRPAGTDHGPAPVVQSWRLGIAKMANRKAKS